MFLKCFTTHPSSKTPSQTRRNRLTEKISFVLTVVVLMCGGARAISGSVHVLSPGHELQWQTIAAGETRVYEFSDLQPSAMYEVKVSWPATYPVDINLELISTDKAGRSASRRLLNAEKILFTTSDDVTLFLRQTRVAFTPRWTGVSWMQDLNKDPPPLIFNIAVDRSISGVPLQCLPHAAFVLIAIIFVLSATFRDPPAWPASLLLSPQTRTIPTSRPKERSLRAL